MRILFAASSIGTVVRRAALRERWFTIADGIAGTHWIEEIIKLANPKITLAVRAIGTWTVLIEASPFFMDRISARVSILRPIAALPITGLAHRGIDTLLRVSKRDGNTEIYVRDADGTDQTPLSANLPLRTAASAVEATITGVAKMTFAGRPY